MMPTNWTTGGNPNLKPAVAGSNSSHRQEAGKVGHVPWSERLFPPPETSPLPFREQRLAYFRNHYDFMTGIRIAGTLGGFFLLVLLTLLYKSKCKKSSHLPSPALSMDTIGQDLLQDHPAQNGISSYNHIPLQETRLLLMDGDPLPRDRPELLLTSPLDLSESSTESDVSINFPGRPTFGLVEPPREKRRRREKCLASPSRVPSFLNQQIDIHIIQPTPSISPSNSEMFPRPNPKISGTETQWKRNRNSTGHRASDSDVNSQLLIFLHAENLKFMDDTSSENLPTRGSDEEVESPSIGSDSVFTFTCDRRRSSASAYTGLEEDDENCGLTLCQATAQVHHRDSFCSSEMESDYLEMGRRSSSTQTTLSDLRRTLPPSPNTPSNGGLDPNYFSMHLLPPDQSNRIPSAPRRESLKRQAFLLEVKQPHLLNPTNN